MRRCLLTGAAFIAAGVFVPMLFFGEVWLNFLIEWAHIVRLMVAIFVCGPVTFLMRVVPAISFNAELAACGTVAFGLSVVLIHRLGRGASAPAGNVWPLARSVRIALLVPALFGAAVAAVGIVHQSGWLFRSGVVKSSWADFDLDRQRHTLGTCYYLFVEKHGRPPDSMEELARDFSVGWLQQFQANGWRYVPKPPADGNPILFVAPSRLGAGQWVVCRTEVEMPELRPPLTPEADVIAELRAQKRLR